MQSYMICAVPRTGSYLLCDLLQKTGVAGRPNEYFNPMFQSHWAGDWGTATLPEYLDKVVVSGTTPNGVFGLKVHPMQFDSLCRQLARRPRVPYTQRPGLLERQFPELRYVRLRRRDGLRQAVSYVRAIQTRAWWDSDHAPGPNGPVEPDRLRFDFQLIERAVGLLEAMDRRWSAYFDAIGASPLEFEYEELTSDPNGAVRAVLDLLAAHPRRAPLPLAGPRHHRASCCGDHPHQGVDLARTVGTIAGCRRRPEPTAVPSSQHG